MKIGSFQTFAKQPATILLFSGAPAHRNFKLSLPLLSYNYCRVLLFVEVSKLSDVYPHLRKEC